MSDNVFDVVVVGSGAGGLSTAVAAAHGEASVLVVEKAVVCGGASAWSGGWMWTPRNLFALADGVNEDRMSPRSYLEHRLGDNFRADKVDMLLDGAPEMVEFFENHTALQFVPGATIADIHGDTPGAGTGHRSVAPKPVSLHTLGPTSPHCCAANSTRRRFSAWASWPAPTCRHSCIRHAHRKRSGTAHSVLPDTWSTSP